MSSRSKKRRQMVRPNDTVEAMNVDGGSSWSDRHQILLQYLIHSRMTKKFDLSRVHGKLFNDEESLSDSLVAITNQIKPLKMDVKQIKCDVTGDMHYVVIHTTGEPFFPRCCVFSKTQLDYLKILLTAIVLSGSGKIGKIEAINNCQAMSKSEADDCLSLFVKENILLEVENGGKLCLSPLAIAEFGPFFQGCFADNVTTCDLCKQVVFVGRICENPGCGMKFHRHCASKWMDKKSNCPKCGHEWKFDMNVDTE